MFGREGARVSLSERNRELRERRDVEKEIEVFSKENRDRFYKGKMLMETANLKGEGSVRRRKTLFYELTFAASSLHTVCQLGRSQDILQFDL